MLQIRILLVCGDTFSSSNVHESREEELARLVTELTDKEIDTDNNNDTIDVIEQSKPLEYKELIKDAPYLTMALLESLLQAALLLQSQDLKIVCLNAGIKLFFISNLIEIGDEHIEKFAIIFTSMLYRCIKQNGPLNEANTQIVRQAVQNIASYQGSKLIHYLTLVICSLNDLLMTEERAEFGGRKTSSQSVLHKAINQFSSELVLTHANQQRVILRPGKSAATHEVEETVPTGLTGVCLNQAFN